VAKVTLPEIGEDPTSAALASVVGWGAMEDGGLPVDRVRVADVNVLSDAGKGGLQPIIIVNKIHINYRN